MFDYKENYFALFCCILNPRLTPDKALKKMGIVQKEEEGDIINRNRNDSKAHFLIKDKKTEKIFKIYCSERINGIYYDTVLMYYKQNRSSKKFEILQRTESTAKDFGFRLIDTETGMEHIGKASELAKKFEIEKMRIYQSLSNYRKGKTDLIKKRYKIIEKVDI